MTKKPSLYVVERREVVILVVLFVLVTVLAFTLGVKYGENVGERNALAAAAEREKLAAMQGPAGGVLGESSSPSHAAGTESKVETTAASEPHSAGTPEKASVDNKAGAPGQTMLTGPAGTQAGAVIAAESPSGAGATPPPVVNPDTDEYLLQALRDAGIEKTAPLKNADAEKTEPNPERDDSAGLPAEVKRTAAAQEKRSGSRGEAVGAAYTIQVASYLSEADARRYADKLKASRLTAEISPVVDSGAGRRYTVTLGRYSDLDRATETARSYKARGLIESYFVRKVR